MCENFKFESIDISCRGPFPDNSSINFLNGINVISAGNGLGKTTIFNSIIDYFDQKYNYEKIDAGLLKKLIFINHESIILNDFILLLKHNQINIHELETEVSECLSELMAAKFSAGQNKFSRYRKNLDYITLKIEQSGAVIFLTGNSEDISHNFDAHEERIALLFSFNLAIRKFLGIDFPLVCDDLFSSTLPSEVIAGLIHKLIKQNIQLILLAHPEVWRRLKIKPTIELELDADKRHSIIHRPLI